MRFDQDGNIILPLNQDQTIRLYDLISYGCEDLEERIENEEKIDDRLRCYTPDELAHMRKTVAFGKVLAKALDHMNGIAGNHSPGSWVTNLPNLLDTIHRLVSLTDQEKFNQIERDQLLARFPWLDTDEPTNGGDAVDGLLDWYHSLTPGVERSGTG